MSKVISLKSLQSEGKKVARLACNRDLNVKIVNAKKSSMKTNGLLVPAIMVDAVDALKASLEIIDFASKEVVTEANASSYVVLIDANHRYQAHTELLAEEKDYNKEFYLMYPLNSELSIPKMLAEINTATSAWKGSDFGKGAKMMCSEKLPLLDSINELTSKGYSLDSACKWLTFMNKINKTVLGNAMDGTVNDVLRNVSGIQRGKNLLEAALTAFDEGILKTRTIPDWVIKKYDNTPDSEKHIFEPTIVSFFNSLKRVDVKGIESAKGKRGSISKEQIIFSNLDELFNKFLEVNTKANQAA
jgi:hypothetical protein